MKTMDSHNKKEEKDKAQESTESSYRALSPNEIEMFTKVEEKLKSELIHAKEIEKVEEDDRTQDNNDRTLYAYCSACQDNIFIHYTESIVKNASSYPVYLVWVHGKPFHGLLVRIDKNFVSRGERVVHLEFDPNLSDQYS